MTPEHRLAACAIRGMRHASGTSTEQLAKLCGTQRQALERAARSGCGFKTLHRWVHAFNERRAAQGKTRIYITFDFGINERCSWSMMDEVGVHTEWGE